MTFLFGRRKLFGNNIPPACEYCQNGLYSADRQILFCIHKGIVDLHFNCRKFSYNPLHRIPHVMQKLPQFDPDDFKL